MFESISLVSYNVIAPKPYVAPTSNSTDPLGLKWGAVEYLASCLSKLKQHATQLSIEGGRADNEISTKPHKNLEDLMDKVIRLMIAYNMGKNLVEPVWLRTNKYIYNLLNKSFFSSESFNPTLPYRFEFEQCLVLDFGDAWVAKHGPGSSDEVTLAVPSQFRSSQCHVGSNREVKGCVPNKAPWALRTILDSKLLSFKWLEAVSDILSASTQSDPSTTRE
ncbi:hypothetical protein O181_077907 [Austropuccinia psidii MF-1]|uniref:Uncharacterized protein n=1 Tax=Austropuccinia psidii MF-1 TaxID=1389203 RepID=A0A9Q3FGV1_9BASI|nr:hypothetical protein [Austropuccinia psidii MF-1]